MEDSKKFRHEYKHFISFSDYIELKNRLKVFLNRDTNSSDDGKYKIISVYFDNYNDKALREKFSGVSKREKFRIRFYNNDLSFIRLEKKSKFKNLCLKENAVINKEEFKNIILNDIDFLKHKDEPLLKEFYAKLRHELIRPTNLTIYTREAYTYPIGNVRVTFDYDIKGNNNVLSLFNGTADGVPVAPNYIVLEVKYDNFIPQFILDLLQLGDRKATAFSKYGATRLF